VPKTISAELGMRISLSKITSGGLAGRSPTEREKAFAGPKMKESSPMYRLMWMENPSPK